MLSRKNLHILWIFGLSMATIGASWDASYHFKYIRDLTQAPHIFNAIGNFLVLVALFFFWKKTPKEKRGSLKICLLGIGIFVLDIPLDDMWHRFFGLDLTAWSPTHLGLYYGTTVLILGMIRQVLSDGQNHEISFKSKKIFLLILSALLFNSVWFPMIQQEQGVVALYQLKNGTSIAGPDVLRYAAISPKAIIFKWTPDWLYLTYALFVTFFIFSLIKQLKVHMFVSTIAVFFYLIFRVVMNFIYANTAYQQSAIPYFLLPVAIVFDWVMVTRKYGTREKIISLVFFETVFMYSITFIKTNQPIYPPIAPISLVLALPAGIIGYFLAKKVFTLLYQSLV